MMWPIVRIGELEYEFEVNHEINVYHLPLNPSPKPLMLHGPFLRPNIQQLPSPEVQNLRCKRELTTLTLEQLYSL